MSWTVVVPWMSMSDCKVFFFFFSVSLGGKGDLENRAQLREPANILIFNTSRKDTAEYRCEVAAIEDQRDFDEILISLAVRGTSSRCITNLTIKDSNFVYSLYLNPCFTLELYRSPSCWRMHIYSIFFFTWEAWGVGQCPPVLKTWSSTIWSCQTTICFLGPCMWDKQFDRWDENQQKSLKFLCLADRFREEEAVLW